MNRCTHRKLKRFESSRHVFLPTDRTKRADPLDPLCLAPAALRKGPFVARGNRFQLHAVNREPDSGVTPVRLRFRTLLYSLDHTLSSPVPLRREQLELPCDHFERSPPWLVRLTARAGFSRALLSFSWVRIHLVKRSTLDAFRCRACRAIAPQNRSRPIQLASRSMLTLALALRPITAPMAHVRLWLAPSSTVLSKVPAHVSRFRTDSPPCSVREPHSHRAHHIRPNSSRTALRWFSYRHAQGTDNPR